MQAKYLYGKTSTGAYVPVQVTATGQIVVSVITKYKGWFATSAALTTAYPTGQDGWYAIVGATDTVWVWDSTTVAWKDSGLGSLVTSVNTKVGAVVLNAGDVGADVAGAAAAVLSTSAQKASNLSDLTNAATARTSLGLGTAAQNNTGDFDAAGAASSAQSAAIAATNKDRIEFAVSGNGFAITTGIKGDKSIPFNCTITGYDIVADQAGAIEFDLWVDTLANFPPTIADTIVAAAPVKITATADKATDSTLTGWSKNLTKGSVMRLNCNSATTIKRVAIILYVTKT
jgi:hypothetical protein